MKKKAFLKQILKAGRLGLYVPYSSSKINTGLALVKHGYCQVKDPHNPDRIGATFLPTNKLWKVLN